jgi:hypothetical protein
VVGSAIRDGIDLIETFLSSEAGSFVGGGIRGVFFVHVFVFPG